MINFLGFNAVFAGLMGVVIGLVLQIVKNWRRKSCEGLSLPWMILVFYAYFSWLMYGIWNKDIFLTIPQSLGSICTAVILVQFWIYRKK